VETKVVDIKELSDHQREGMSVAGVVMVKVTRYSGRRRMPKMRRALTSIWVFQDLLHNLKEMSHGRITETLRCRGSGGAMKCPIV
jgi:hypothetical protein